ncbi:MAG TPA: NAD-dependent epimerase/dehydratase family protein [Gemmatimonadota bacterium]|nr:NAD-dependent epimerase/dehydratase family protein [Gemmatimonadota bacterium]
MKRRHFVGKLAAGVALSGLPLAGSDRFAIRSGDGIDRALDPPRERLRVLVLGGTNYVGPHVVQAALDRGHAVTTFNRGFHNPRLFPAVERLVGNRFRDRGRGLSALEGDREWDLVVDTWDSEPGCIHDTTRLLADRVGRYVYVSSIAVLRSFRDVGLDESSPTVDAEAHINSFDPELGYALAKRAGELGVLDAFGDRGTVLRCSGVWGHDPHGAQLSYWGLRFLSNEPFLVPDDRTAVVQWSDARDIGRFAAHAAEEALGGVFHIINTPEPVPLWDVLTTWDAIVGGRSGMVPAPRPFLDRHGLRPWVDIPHYIPDDDPEPGFSRISAARAHATGFPFRPLATTIADEARSCPPHLSPALATRGALDRRRELRLVAELTG